MSTVIRSSSDEIERAVRAATHNSVAYLKVSDRGDEVLLTGCCPTFICKKLAQDATQPLLRGARLTNLIEVR